MRKCVCCGLDNEKNICFKCGCFVDGEVGELATKEEHVTVLNNLLRKVHNYEEARQKVDDYKPQKPIPYPATKTFWGCFWKYIIITIIISNIATFFFSMIVGICVEFVSVFVCIAIANAEKERINNEILTSYEKSVSRAKENAISPDALRRDRDQALKVVNAYSDYVPKKYLDSSNVKRLVNNMEIKGANTISEAVSMLDAV